MSSGFTTSKQHATAMPSMVAAWVYTYIHTHLSSSLRLISLRCWRTWICIHACMHAAGFAQVLYRYEGKVSAQNCEAHSAQGPTARQKNRPRQLLVLDIHMYIYIYRLYTYICIYVHIEQRMHIYIHKHTHTRTHIYIYICMQLYNIYVCMYIYIYIYICILIFLSIYTYVHT